ncbi:MAG TPA: tetratricopeptide repeat protein, partial [Verrucomicrobiae bacterium]|nr:tetratricopeptide repeat protein [Verrucomicrobiae bacterium]
MAVPGPFQRRRGERGPQARVGADRAALDRRRTIAGWMIPAGVALVAIACFLPALRNDFVLWDDDLNFTDNPSYRGLSWRQLRWMFTTVHGGHYQPLSWVTLGLDYTLWGMNPAGYHLTSLLLHAANAVLFYHVVLALLRRAGLSGPALAVEGAAGVGALFFAVHPLRVEAVAWASERRDVLSSLFYLATVLAYLHMAEEEGSGRARRWYLVSLACFVLSLLSQAWGITLPVVLLALDVFPLRRAPRLWEKAPYAALALGAAALAFVAQQHQPAMHTLAQHGVLQRTAQAAYGLCFYLWKTVAPWRLSPAYLLEGRLDPAAPRYLLCLVAVTAITAVLLLARRRWPSGLVAWACYAAIASPVLGFVQTGPQIAADRYTYLACLPWAVLVAAAVQRAALARGRLAWPVSAAALVALGVLTIGQIAVWRDSFALWEYTLRIDPTNYIAYTNRGVARHARGDLEGAFADYDAALRYNPGHAEAYNDRGIVRFAHGDMDGAIADYSAAIRLRPEYADAYENRGIAREAKGDLDGALADYSAAIRLRPTWAKACYSRANVRLAK